MKRQTTTSKIHMGLYVLTQLELGSQSQSQSHLYKIQWDAALFPYEYWINCAIFWIKHHRLDFNSCVPFRVIVVSWWPRLNAHHSNLIQKKAIKSRDRNRDSESDTTSSLVYIFMAIHVELLCNPLTYNIHTVSTEYTRTKSLNIHRLYYIIIGRCHFNIYLCLVL